MAKRKCECVDSECPAHFGHSCCENNATVHGLLYRIDMEDQNGTYFCNDCAEDAMQSGLFTDDIEDDDTFEEEENQ